MGLTNLLSNTTVYAQANHLDQLCALLADSENKVRTMLRDRGYIYNSYLGNV